MTGAPLPDPEVPPACIFERRQTPAGLEQLARLGARAGAHYEAYLRANEVFAARVSSTGELLLIDVPV